MELGCLEDLAGFYTIGTNHHFFNSAVWDRPHPLKIWIEATLGYIVGMTDIASYQRLFAAYFAHPWHEDSPFWLKFAWHRPWVKSDLDSRIKVFIFIPKSYECKGFFASIKSPDRHTLSAIPKMTRKRPCEPFVAVVHLLWWWVENFTVSETTKPRIWQYTARPSGDTLHQDIWKWRP